MWRMQTRLLETVGGERTAVERAEPISRTETMPPFESTDTNFCFG